MINSSSSTETTQDEDEQTSDWYVGKSFEPLRLTSGHYNYNTRLSSTVPTPEEAKYVDLSEESLFGNEREWAANFILSKQMEERNAGRDYGARTFANKLGLNSSTVQSWVTKLRRSRAIPGGSDATFNDNRGIHFVSMRLEWQQLRILSEKVDP